MTLDTSTRPTPVAGRRWGLWRGLFVSLALLAVGSGVVWYHNWSRPGAQVPGIDLAGIDPEVADAIKSAIDAVGRQPHSGEAWGLLARRLQAYKYFPQALVCYAEAERLDPGNGDWPYLRAVILENGPEPTEAIVHWRRSAELHRDNPLPRIRLGEALLEAGRPEEAKAQLEAALAIRPGNPRAHLRLAQVAADAGQWHECLRHLESNEGASPVSKHACSLRVRALEGLGDLEAARRLKEQLASLPPDPPWPDAIVAQLAVPTFGLRTRVLNAVQLARENNLDEALSLMQETVQKYPQSDLAWDRLGRVLVAMKRPGEAEYALRRSLEITPQSGDVWYFLGLVLQGQGKFDEALAALRQAMKEKSTDADVHYHVGVCLANKGDRAGAEAAYRRALRYQPGHAQARERLGLVSKEPLK